MNGRPSTQLPRCATHQQCRRSATHQTFRRLTASRAATVSSPAVASCDEAVALLKQASNNAKVEKPEVFKALRTVQKAKSKADDWASIIGCNKFWRLIFTADKKAVQASMKHDSGGSGIYFPLTAAQKFNLSNPPKGTIQNAVIIPYIAMVQFSGNYEMKGTRLSFTFDAIRLRLKPFNLGPFQLGSQAKEDGKPFFIFFYADDDIICAQGKGGGIALWAKVSPQGEVEKGLLA